MKLGLASYQFRNKDTAFNLSQVEKGMQESRGKVDLLCFGEAFLQGFDALDWNYETDKEMAITPDSEVMEKLCRLTVEYGMDLLLGYIEKEGEILYSSCAVIEKGKLIHNYRRISKGWKCGWLTDSHYREGCAAKGFLYHGRKIQIALCGDMWEFPEKFKTDDLLIWPVYCTFSLEEWKTTEQEYADQALLACPKTVMINSITEEPADPVSHGNAFYFHNGSVEKKLDYDREAVLIVEV